MDAVSFTVRYLEVTRPSSASADNDGIVLFPYLGCIDIDADMCIGNEGLMKLCYFDVEKVIEILTMPSAAMRSMRRCTIALSSFILKGRSGSRIT